jgi:hypothetical protein
MLKSTQLRTNHSASGTPGQPKKSGPLHEGPLGTRRQKLITLDEAAPRLGVRPATMNHLIRGTRLRHTTITMPDGSKERLRIVKLGRMNRVRGEDLQQLVTKREAIAGSTMRLGAAMRELGIAETTKHRHLARDGGVLYFEVRTPEGRKRFKVSEASPVMKSMLAEDVSRIKRLLARMHGKLSFDELAKDFKPGNNYDVREAALLTGFAKARIRKMIRKGDLDAKRRLGRLHVRGAGIKKYFEEHKKAPKDLVGTVKAAEILAHDSRWISRRLVKRDGAEFLEYKNGPLSISIKAHRLNIWRGFSRSELSGLKLIEERIPFISYLSKHREGHADFIHGRFSDRMSEHVSEFSVGGQRMEERKCSLAPEYGLNGRDIRIIKAGGAVFVRPQDARLVEGMVLSALLRGSEGERDAAIAVLEGTKTVSEADYRLAEGALTITFTPALVGRLRKISAGYLAQQARTE